MSICPSCKAANPDSYQFCQFCGAKIAIDIVLNILGEEALQPSSLPTRPLNLESVLDTIKIQVHDLASSQLVSDIEKSWDGSEDLEELPLEFDLEDFADVDSETSMIVSSTVQLQDITYAGKTDVGIQRDRNEDDFVAVFKLVALMAKAKLAIAVIAVCLCCAMVWVGMMVAKLRVRSRLILLPISFVHFGSTLYLGRRSLMRLSAMLTKQFSSRMKMKNGSL